MTTTILNAIVQDARLRMLQGMVEQTDGRLSDRMLVHVLDGWGHRRTVEFVRTQLRALAELGAVRLVEDSEAVIVAALTRPGEDHVRRRGVIDGVKRPDAGD